MRFPQTRRRQQPLTPSPRKGLLLLLLPAVSGMATAATMGGATTDSMSHNFWWWLALGLSGFFIVLLMFLLLFFWYFSRPSQVLVPESSRQGTCDPLAKQDNSGGHAGLNTTVSPLATALRRGSTDTDDGRRGSGDVSVCCGPSTKPLHSLDDVYLMMSLGEGRVTPLLRSNERPSKRQPKEATMLVEGYGPKRAKSGSAKRSPCADLLHPIAAVAQRAAPVTSRRQSLSSNPLGAAPGTSTQLQPSPPAQRQRSRDNLAPTKPRSCVDVAANSSGTPLAGAGLHRSTPSVFTDNVDGTALHSTVLVEASATGKDSDSGVNHRTATADGLTSPIAPAVALDGKAASPPLRGAPLQQQQRNSRNAVKQYYFGFKRAPGTEATGASLAPLSLRASHEAEQAPRQRPSPLVLRSAEGAHSGPALGLSHQAFPTNSISTAAALAASTSCVLRDSLPSLTSLGGLPPKASAPDGDGAAAARLPPSRASQCCSLHPQPNPRLELFRVSDEGSGGVEKGAMSGARIDPRPVSQLDSMEKSSTGQPVVSHGAAPSSNPRSHRRPRRHSLPPQPSGRPSSGPVTLSAAQRTSLNGRAAARRSLSATVTGSVPQLFSGKRKASLGWPPATAEAVQPSRRVSGGTRNDRGSVVVPVLPAACAFSPDSLTGISRPSPVASPYSSTGLQSKVTAAATVAAQDLSTTATAAIPTDCAPISFSSRAASPHRGSLGSSVHGPPPMRSTPTRLRNPMLVTFVSKEGPRVSSVSRDGDARPPILQPHRRLQLSQSLEGPAGSFPSIQVGPSAGDCGEAAQLGDLPNSASAVSPALAAVATSEAANTCVSATPREDRGPVLPSATAALGLGRERSPATRRFSAAATPTLSGLGTTAAPAALPMGVAAHRATATSALPATFGARQQVADDATAAAAVGPDLAKVGGGAVGRERYHSEDGCSVRSEVSTIAAGILPAARGDRRGSVMMPPSYPNTASPAQLISPRASPYSVPHRAPHRVQPNSSRIEVLRITHPTGVVHESPAPSVSLEQRSRYSDTVDRRLCSSSASSSHHHLASLSSTAVPSDSPF